MFRTIWTMSRQTVEWYSASSVSVHRALRRLENKTQNTFERVCKSRGLVEFLAVLKELGGGESSNSITNLF